MKAKRSLLGEMMKNIAYVLSVNLKHPTVFGFTLAVMFFYLTPAIMYGGAVGYALAAISAFVLLSTIGIERHFSEDDRVFSSEYSLGEYVRTGAYCGVIIMIVGMLLSVIVALISNPASPNHISVPAGVIMFMLYSIAPYLLWAVLTGRKLAESSGYLPAHVKVYDAIAAAVSGKRKQAGEKTLSMRQALR